MKHKILNHFKTVDPVIHKAAKKVKLELLVKLEPEMYFERLCRAIVGQQLSVMAARTIWGRFEELLPKKELTPKNILRIKHEDMRKAGMSNAKARYVKGIAEAYDAGEIDFLSLAGMADEKVAEELIRLKGVGQWTVEMFLMFTLGRPDVFSYGDLGLRRAMERLYEIEELRPEQAEEISSKWSPWRTYACMVLWETIDNNPDV